MRYEENNDCGITVFVDIKRGCFVFHWSRRMQQLKIKIRLSLCNIVRIFGYVHNKGLFINGKIIKYLPLTNATLEDCFQICRIPYYIS